MCSKSQPHLWRVLIAAMMCTAALLLPTATRVNAGGHNRINTGATVTTTSNGIRIVLHVAHRSYPRNALIRYWLTISNVAHRPLPKAAAPTWEVQVIGPNGAVLYPLPLPPGFAPAKGFVPGGQRPDLPATYHKTFRRLTVLRSGRLQASVYVGPEHVLVSTPVLHLRTYPARAPRLRLMSTGAWWARFVPVRPGHPPLLFNASYICEAGNGRLSGGTGWKGANPTFIQPKDGFPWCTQLLYLQLTAGYRGQPVADLIWKQPGWVPL